MPRSIRGRLTLWLALLIALCLAAFALSLYVAVRGALIGDLDHTLQVQAQQVAMTYDFGGQNSNDNTGQHVDIGAVDQFTMGGVYVELFDAGGHMLGRSSNLGTRSLPLPAPAATLPRAAPHTTTLAGSYGALRVYSLPVRSGGQTSGLVLVGASLHEVTTTTQTLLAALAVAGVIAVTLAALGVGVLVRRGLRPLDAMAGAVEGIDAHDLDRRLALRALPVEVARLGGAFDAMLARLRASFATQRRFVGDASHELRGPLAAIRGRGDVLLLDPTLDAEARVGIAMMRDEAARMGRLVANLLLLARGDEARAIDRRAVELDVLLLEAARQARAPATARGVTVALGHEDQATAWGDADLLKQLLLNLVDNAVAYTPPGGRVELSLNVDGMWTRLSVRDTGPGIPAADLERIFERFYRLDEARTRRSGGAGLGLAIARWIAEAHGGHIAVESVVGQGSVFTIVLPLHDAPHG
jgi:two-component system OmpR family sensor kinase